ncbi:hypothetical protein ILUMI_13296 [Ignelater luminosus]|uniref:Cytochrome b5-related protein n=1 Tax=Ignelater luminosus TaxID=2038154 RepID=A0A8K0CUS1_IGNLU|nr:hypothetical protein ILUMI_13296 [Ignelater luminosus]
MWLDEKRKTDGAEGLWRIHDNLYDLTDFIRNHPGGQFWLEATKGIDITEAFESHHISDRPEKILKKYYVRKAKTPRSSPYTFENDGFYRTLKRNVRKELKCISRKNGSSNIIADSLLIATFAFAILANMHWSSGFAVASGICFGFTLVASHNYTHQKDNFRMYYSDICMMQSREWRILHVLSHHLFTNTVLDSQVYFSEPFVLFYPQRKPIFVRYGTWVYTLLLLWPNLLHVGVLLRICQLLFYGRVKQIGFGDLLPFILPLVMYMFNSDSIISTIGMWLVIETIGSLTFSFLGYTTGHFHPNIFIDGDKPRAKNDRDWGIIQLDCVSDRREILGNKFLVLVSFGDHALHHLFPTLDHAILHELYPIVYATMKDFGVDIWMTNHPQMLVGYFKQLARTQPNLKYPNSLEKNNRKS